MSKIEWCDISINPFTGCTNGCKYCYARRFAARLGGKKGTAYWRLKQRGLAPFTPAVHLDVWEREFAKLSRSKKTKRVFLGSMSDLCCVESPQSWVVTGDPKEVAINTTGLQRKILESITALPQHTFLMLTKRPLNFAVGDWPDNLHLGVSATNDREADDRLYDLAETRAGIHWISLEPLVEKNFNPKILDGLGWVVIGAMTGPHAFECPAETAWNIRLWCLDHHIPVFVKDNLIKQAPQYPWPQDFPK